MWHHLEGNKMIGARAGADKMVDKKQSKRLLEARARLAKLKRKIAPYTRKPKYKNISTRGQWVKAVNYLPPEEG